MVVTIILCTFAPEASRAGTFRGVLANRAIALSHGGQGTMRKQMYSLQKQKVMQQNIYYIKYALQFADMQITELVEIFNRQVGNRGWTGMRAYHDQALIDEFQRRGIDVSTIKRKQSICFSKPIKYDILNNALLFVS